MILLLFTFVCILLDWVCLQVVYVYLPVDEEGGETAGDAEVKTEGTVDTQQLIQQVQPDKVQSQPEYIQVYCQV